MLTQGARSVLRGAEAKGKTDLFSRWVCEVAKYHGRHKSIIAIAKKIARVGCWVMLAKDLHYGLQPLCWPDHTNAWSDFKQSRRC